MHMKRKTLLLRRNVIQIVKVLMLFTAWTFSWCYTALSDYSSGS